MLQKITISLGLMLMTTGIATPMESYEQMPYDYNEIIKLDDQLQELCNHIVQIWQAVDYTPEDTTFLSLHKQNTGEIPLETLLSALMDTMAILNAVHEQSPNSVYKDIQSALESITQSLLAASETRKIDIAESSRNKAQNQKAPTFGSLNILNNLTVNGPTNLGKNLKVNGNISAGSNGQFCFNATTNSLGIGTKNPTCKLDVRGSSNIQNNLSIGGNLTMPHCADGVLHAKNGLMTGSSIIKKDLADNSVTTFALADLSVTNDKLSRDAVTGDKIKSPLAIKGNVTFNDGLNALGSVEPGLRVIRGTVAADGTILSGTGFTVTVVGTGLYTITFDNAFSDASSYMIIAATSDDYSNVGNPAASAKNVSAHSATVQTYINNADSASAQAKQFGFFVIGS